MKVIKKIINVFEIIIPMLMLAILFVSFIIGVFTRYFLHNPMTWTYELCSICFLNLVVYSWSYVQSKNEHITFDMIYEKVNNKTKNIFNIVSYILMIIFSMVLLYYSLIYIKNNGNSVTQVMKIPKIIIYACFPVSFLIYTFRAFEGLLKCINGKRIN